VRLLEGYIGRTVAGHIVGVMLVLLAIYFFSGMVAELRQIGKGEYDFAAAMLYSLMLLPRQAYELFPLVALLGTMLGLGALANTSELTVMRAAGVSVRRILLATLKMGLVLAALATLLGEVVAPPLEKEAKLARAQALAENFSVNTSEGLWARDGRTYINIRRLFADGRASGVSLYRFGDAHELKSVVAAHTAVYHEGEWLLEQVTVNRIEPDGVSTQRHQTLRWSSALNPALINLVAVKPEYLSVWDLRGYLSYMEDNGLEARQYRLALWKRLLAPLVTAGMVLLAVPFVLGSLRTVSIGQRILVGTLIGIGFYLFNAVFNQIALVYAVPPSLASMLPTMVVYALWAVMMRRVY